MFLIIYLGYKCFILIFLRGDVKEISIDQLEVTSDIVFTFWTHGNHVKY